VLEWESTIKLPTSTIILSTFSVSTDMTIISTSRWTVRNALSIDMSFQMLLLQAIKHLNPPMKKAIKPRSNKEVLNSDIAISQEKARISRDIVITSKVNTVILGVDNKIVNFFFFFFVLTVILYYRV
jgi:hypothetical protein